MLYALARGLQLNDAETTHLLDLARTATQPRCAPRMKTEPRVPARLAQLLDTMSDVPAIVMSRVGDPVASNALGRALFPHLFPDGTKPLNSAKYMFLDQRAQSFYPDWETVAREAVSGLRLMAGQDPSDRALMSLVGELATRSEDFRTWWGGHTVRIHTSGTKRLNHPVVGELTLGYETLVVPSAPGLSMATYLPEPGTTSADALNMLRSWTASPNATTTRGTGLEAITREN